LPASIVFAIGVNIPEVWILVIFSTAYTTSHAPRYSTQLVSTSDRRVTFSASAIANLLDVLRRLYARLMNTTNSYRFEVPRTMLTREGLLAQVIDVRQSML
jgi:hypothetical protein